MGSLWGPPYHHPLHTQQSHSGVAFLDSDTGFFWAGGVAVGRAAVYKTDSQSNLVGGWL